MKQTAVEWLVEQIKDYDFADIKDNEYYFIQIPTWILKEKIEQAKAMELEQLEFFFKQGHLHSGCPYGLEETYKKTFTNESKTNL